VSVRSSASRQVDALVSDLGASDDVRREAAVARLIVIGARAVERLLRVATSEAAVGARLAAWRALEAIGDLRALDAALATLADRKGGPAECAAAASVARAFMRGPRGAAVVDALTSVALDRGRADAVRLAAFRALSDLGAATIAPVVRTLADDPSALVRREVSANGTAAADPSALTLDQPADPGSTPDEPFELRSTPRGKRPRRTRR
jgi:hypothetical protein